MPTFSLGANDSLYFEHTAPTADGGATFVFFNALSGNIDMWKAEIVPALHAAGHGSLLYNMRGQPQSSFSDLSATEPDAIVADAVALVQHVAPVIPVYVGLSIGGLFACNAHLGGAPAAGILTLNTMRIDGTRLEWINTAVARAAALGGSALVMDLYAPMLFDEPWLAANRENALDAANYAPLDPHSGTFGMLSRGSAASWAVPWESVSVPVTVVTGLKDRVFYTEEDVAGIVARLPDATRINVPDAGHMVPLEQPRVVIDALIELASRIG